MEDTGFMTEDGFNIKTGQNIKVLIRNNVTVKGIVEKIENDYCVVLEDQNLIISECFKPKYNHPLDSFHPVCGERYAVFYMN
jgi:hypothetical protein